ncbi:hypothetical protein Bca101_062234 [Brassica carinata]
MTKRKTNDQTATEWNTEEIHFSDETRHQRSLPPLAKLRTAKIPKEEQGQCGEPSSYQRSQSEKNQVRMEISHHGVALHSCSRASSSKKTSRSKAIEMSGLNTWILVNSTRYDVIIDTYMRDHVFLLFRLSMKAVVKEASGFMRESDANAAGE